MGKIIFIKCLNIFIQKLKGGDILAEDSLKKIIEAESERNIKISKGKLEAEKILDEVQTEITGIKVKTKEKSKKDRDSILEAAKVKAVKDYEPHLLEFEAKLKALSSINDSKIQKAINIIKERVVNFSGNS